MTENREYFNILTNKYPKSFKKCGIDAYDLERLERDGQIIMTVNTYRKDGRKCFPKKASETETKEITAINLANGITGIEFFNDRITKAYTKYGYIVVRMACVCPDGNTKIERLFKYE